MPETIADLVKQNVQLQAVLQELLKRKYLVPGILHPEAYLIDNGPLEEKWNNRPADECLEVFDVIAIGVVIYNDFFAEATANYFARKDYTCKEETSDWLEEWNEYVFEHFSDNWDAAFDEEDITDIAAKLGQYLEFMNRTSQSI